MDKSTDASVSGSMSSFGPGPGRQGGLSASSSTSNISSSFRQTMNGSLGNSRPSFRSRLGALARSAINDSEESGFQLSPNSVKGMISVRSHLGLPPLENSSSASNLLRRSKTPPTTDTDGLLSNAVSPPEPECHTNSASQGYASLSSNQELSANLKSVEILRGTEHSAAYDSGISWGIPNKNCNSFNVSADIEPVPILPSPYTSGTKIEPEYKDSSIEFRPFKDRFPTPLDQNQNLPPQPMFALTPDLDQGRSYGNVEIPARPHSIRKNREFPLRRSALVDPLLKRKPLTLSHNVPPLEMLTPIGSRRFPTSSSNHIIIKTPSFKPPPLSFSTVMHAEQDSPFTPKVLPVHVPVNESNMSNNNRMPLKPTTSNHDNPVEFPSRASEPLIRNAKLEAVVTPAPAAPVLSARELCPPPPPPVPHSSINKAKLSRSVKKPAVPCSRRRRAEWIQGKGYDVVKLLGKGGCGEVFQVLEQETGETYALKTVNLAGLNESSINECINEVKMLEELKDTGLVIQIVSWERNSVDQMMKIVMECGQRDLSKSITNKVDIIKLKYIWQSMLYIVDLIHKRGIVHADLKPANFVWVGENLKIIDFGIANRLQMDHTSIATLNPKGTLNFISPETITPDAYGKTKMSRESDIWSLGCILHLLVFGSTPFQGITHAQAKMSAIMKGVTAYPPMPEGFRGTGVLSVLKLCLEKDYKLRPTAAELLMNPFLQRIGCTNCLDGDEV